MWKAAKLIGLGLLYYFSGVMLLNIIAMSMEYDLKENKGVFSAISIGWWLVMVFSLPYLHSEDTKKDNETL